MIDDDSDMHDKYFEAALRHIMTNTHRHTDGIGRSQTHAECLRIVRCKSARLYSVEGSDIPLRGSGAQQKVRSSGKGSGCATA